MSTIGHKKVKARFCLRIKGVLFAKNHKELLRVDLLIASDVALTAIPVSSGTGGRSFLRALKAKLFRSVASVRLRQSRRAVLGPRFVTADR